MGPQLRIMNFRLLKIHYYSYFSFYYNYLNKHFNYLEHFKSIKFTDYHKLNYFSLWIIKSFSSYLMIDYIVIDELQNLKQEAKPILVVQELRQAKIYYQYLTQYFQRFLSYLNPNEYRLMINLHSFKMMQLHLLN